MAFLIGGANSAAADASYTVDNSCRFDGANDYMVRSATGTSSESNNKWTFSCWVKRTKLGAEQMIMDHRGSGNQFNIRFMADDSLQAYDYVGGILMQKDTNAVYRDVAAWYHILWSSDRSIASPTTKLYVNGTEVTSFATSNEYSQDDTGAANQNYDTWIGGENSSGSRLGAYMAEMVWLDGTFVSDATDFGEFDSDSPNIWKPKDVSGLTFGTNGWWLDFEASDNLGNDANGGTDFGETGIAAADQATDTCTNNFCTMNPLDNFYQGHTFSEGNCKVVTQANNIYTFCSGTIGVSSGKWYAECKLAASGGYADIGIADTVSSGTVDSLGGDANEYAKHDFSANVTAQGSGVSNGSALSVGNICGVFLDLDNSKLYFSINGSLQNTTGIGITAAASTKNGYYLFGGGDEDGGSAVTLEWNFGGCSAFAISSAANDDNNYGNFEYTPTVTVESVETKFYALCTKNLAEFG